MARRSSRHCASCSSSCPKDRERPGQPGARREGARGGRLPLWPMRLRAVRVAEVRRLQAVVALVAAGVGVLSRLEAVELADADGQGLVIRGELVVRGERDLDLHVGFLLSLVFSPATRPAPDGGTTS